VGGGDVTRREALTVVLISVAMIAAGLTWLYGPWGLAGTGIALLLVTATLINERKETKPDA
jgi:hypothetical protein